MKKNALCLVIFLLMGSAVFAQSLEELDNLIDFSKTIKSLNDLNANQQEEILQSKVFVVIEGSIAAITVQDGDNPVIIIDLIGGEWTEDGEIKVYKCRVRLIGKQWLSLVPPDKKSIKEESLTIHRHLLVIGYVETFYNSKEERIPGIVAQYIRNIP